MEDSCEHGNEPSGFKNAGKFLSSCTTSGSQEGLSSMKLVNHIPFNLITRELEEHPHFITRRNISEFYQYRTSHCPLWESTFLNMMSCEFPSRLQ
jgi:hypothetical protein